MDNLSVYRELADSYDRLGQASMRDRFLILAADAALEAGQAAEAERLRQRLLQGSRHHMLRPYNSFAEAVRAADVQTYLRDLKVNYPLEVAQQLLESLQEAPGATGQGALPKPSMDWAKPVPSESAPAIPPTAPLLDITSPPAAQPGDLVAGFPRREDRPASAPLRPGRFDAIPIREEQPSPVSRPLAQPLPGRTLPRSAGAARPSPGVPVAQPATLPPMAAIPPVARRIESSAPARIAPAPAARERETPPQGGAWLNMLLVGVVLAAGLALAAFTVGRPFLPPNWLP